MILLIVAFSQVFSQGTWTQSNLSSECVRAGVVLAGSKIFIAGGARGLEIVPSKVVDIYDVTTKQWSTSALSVARELSAGTVSGNKVYVAGGIDLINLTPFSTIDIFDSENNQWSTSQLSKPRFGAAALSFGNQVIFAGGANLKTNEVFSTVDLLEIETGKWSVTDLSEARVAFCAVQVDSKAIIAGGTDFINVSDKLDIYDFKTGKWVTKKLPLARAFLSGAVVGSKIFFGGGVTNDNQQTNRVDIYDVVSDSWTTSSLSVARSGISCVAACGKVFFIGGGKMNLQTISYESASDVIDIYDPQTGKWTVEKLQRPTFNHSSVGYGNQIFIIGGADMNNSFKTMDIYTCKTTSLNKVQPETNCMQLYPNPATDNIKLVFDEIFAKGELTITDSSGKKIFKTNISGLLKLDISLKNYLSGVYFIQVKTAKTSTTEKFIVTK